MASTASMRQATLIAIALSASVVAQYGEMQMPAGLSPRFYLGTSPQLAERQTGQCSADWHSCLDVNSTSCCPNTQYCIVDFDSGYSAKCCEIGSNCGNPCASSRYQCPTTITVSGQPTVSPACCQRSCTSTSQFKCPSTLGGGCCSYGSMCVSGGCQSTVQPTTSQAVVSIIPAGCTTSQIACPSSIGGGCCNNGLSCTVLDNTNYCASASASVVRTGTNGIMATGTAQSSGSGGLSTGAKAGIGAGLAVFALSVIGLLAWFFLVHRRLVKQEDSQRSASASAPAMSQASGSARPLQGHGRQASDYFGPAATPGPFTDSNSPGTSPGHNRGVPATPQSPGDIQVPVEIDSRNRLAATSPGFEYIVNAPGTLEKTLTVTSYHEMP